MENLTPSDVTAAAPRRPVWRRPLSLAVASVAIAGAVVAVRYQAPETALRRTSSGRAAAAFEVSDLRDASDTVALRSYRGRPVVLNFWASWCVPCRKEMPAFQSVYRKVASDVAFVGMNHQDNREAALALVRKTGVRYPSGFDPDGRVAKEYGLYGMPTTVFISRDGRIVAKQTGEMTEAQLVATLDELFDVRIAREGATSSGG